MKNSIIRGKIPMNPPTSPISAGKNHQKSPSFVGTAAFQNGHPGRCRSMMTWMATWTLTPMTSPRQNFLGESWDVSYMILNYIYIYIYIYICTLYLYILYNIYILYILYLIYINIIYMLIIPIHYIYIYYLYIYIYYHI